MKNKKIILAGGSGFLGQEIARYFSNENQVFILSRQINNVKTNRNNYDQLADSKSNSVKYVKWDAKTAGKWCGVLENSDIIINLAGKTVNCRYNKKNKKEIFDSRIASTKIIGEAIKNCKKPPALWINASSATIYRHAIDRTQDEYTGEFHNDFSVQVCKLWEKAFNEQHTPHTRKVIFRMAVTLGSGGILIPYFNLLKFGQGGKQGSGRQIYSWIHIEDTCRIVEWIFNHQELEGFFNCSSPNPLTNAEFMRELRKQTGHKFGLPSFEWMLKIGAPLIGTETELVLKSRWVLPTRLIDTGYEFKYPHLYIALRDILINVPRNQYHLF